MTFDDLLEKYDSFLWPAKFCPASFYANQENVELNKALVSDLADVEPCINKNDELEMFLYSIMVCLSLVNKLYFYKAKEGMFKNGVTYGTNLDESYRRYHKIYKNEIFDICLHVLSILKEYHKKSDEMNINETKNAILASVYCELAACSLFNGLEKEFLDYSAKGIALGSISCANYYISYLYEHDRHEEAQNLFDKLFFKEWNQISQPDFQSFIVENESAFNFVYKGLLHTGKFEKAKELVIKNNEFLNQEEIINNNQDLFHLYNDMNQGFWNKIKNYENKESKIILDESLLYAYFSEPVILLLPLKAKQFIITSIQVFHFLSTNPDTLDYSSAVMPIMRCIETLLYEIVGKSFLQYLKKELLNRNIDLNELPQDLVYFSNATHKKEFLNNPDWVAIGNALSWTSINVGKKNIPSDLFLDYCYVKIDNDYENIAELFFNGLREIRPKRNKAAHTEIVTFEDARECNDYLLLVNKFIEFLLTKFAFCFEKKR